MISVKEQLDRAIYRLTEEEDAMLPSSTTRWDVFKGVAGTGSSDGLRLFNSLLISTQQETSRSLWK